MSMREFLEGLLRRLRESRNAGQRISRSKAVSLLENEVEEMEMIFSLLVLGFLVGLPSPPMQISLDLVPLMEDELVAMIEGLDTAHEPISRLFSIFDIG